MKRIGVRVNELQINIAKKRAEGLGQGGDRDGIAVDIGVIIAALGYTWGRHLKDDSRFLPKL